MSYRDDLRKLKNMSLEERADMKEKSFPFVLALFIFLLGFLPGIYYWAYDNIFFQYYDVTPFWGFAIFTSCGLVTAFVAKMIYSLFCSEYNKLILDADEEIRSIIDAGIGDAEDLFRLKKGVIERKIPKGTLTQDEFEWHSSNFCWGCGKEHKTTPNQYFITKVKIESWRDGVKRYTKTYTQTAMILVCPECYERLKKADKIPKQNGNLTAKILIALVVLVVIASFLTTMLIYMNDGEDVGGSIGYGLVAGFISLYISSSIGLLILRPLADLIAWHFMKPKEGDSKTKWNFDQIPLIRKFLDMNLPH